MEDGVYRHLSEDEMLHVAVERSLADLRPAQRRQDPHAAPRTAPAQTRPTPPPPQDSDKNHEAPEPPKFLNSANPPEALSQVLYRGFQRYVPPVWFRV